MMQTDVKASYVESASSVFGGTARVKGIYAVAAAGAAVLELADGGASGTVLLKLGVPASATANPVFIPVPGEGIQFKTSIYAKTMTNVTSITVFYG